MVVAVLIWVFSVVPSQSALARKVREVLDEA
jgi:hypothetical protein